MRAPALRSMSEAQVRYIRVGHEQGRCRELETYAAFIRIQRQDWVGGGDRSLGGR